MIKSFPAPRKLTSQEQQAGPRPSTSKLRASNPKSLEIHHDTQRVDSVLRLKATWKDIEERYTPSNHLNSGQISSGLAEEDDDIIDLSTMEIAVDRGVLRKTRAGSHAIGSYGLPGLAGSSYAGVSDEEDSVSEQEWEEADDDFGDWNSNLGSRDSTSLEFRLDQTKREEERNNLRMFLKEEAVQRSRRSKVSKRTESKSDSDDDLLDRIQRLESEPVNQLLPKSSHQLSRGRTRTPGFPSGNSDLEDSSSDDDELRIKTVSSPRSMSSPAHRLHGTSPFKSSRKIDNGLPDSARSLRFAMNNTTLTSSPVPRRSQSVSINGRSLSMSDPSHSRKLALSSSDRMPMTSSPLRQTNFPKRPLASSSQSSPLIRTILPLRRSSSIPAIGKKANLTAAPIISSNLKGKGKAVQSISPKSRKKNQTPPPTKSTNPSSAIRTSPRLNGRIPAKPLEIHNTCSTGKPKSVVLAKPSLKKASTDIVHSIDSNVETFSSGPPSVSTCSPPSSYQMRDNRSESSDRIDAKYIPKYSKKIEKVKKVTSKLVVRSSPLKRGKNDDSDDEYVDDDEEVYHRDFRRKSTPKIKKQKSKPSPSSSPTRRKTPTRSKSVTSSARSRASSVVGNKEVKMIKMETEYLVDLEADDGSDDELMIIC